MVRLGYEIATDTLDINADHLRVKDKMIEINYDVETSIRPVVSDDLSGIILYRVEDTPVIISTSATGSGLSVIHNGISTNIVSDSQSNLDKQLRDTLSYLDL